jgi:hypothetical protein
MRNPAVVLVVPFRHGNTTEVDPDTLVQENSMRTQIRHRLFALAFLLLLPLTSRADLALTFDNSSPFGVTSTDLSAGWAFHTGNGPVVVTALADMNPLPGVGSLVQIYDATGTVVPGASATVLSTDPLVGPTGPTAPFQFNSHAISPVVLAPNTDYFIAGDLLASPSQQGYYLRASGVTTIPGISYLHGVLALGTGQTPTSDPFLNGSQDPAYFGPNFQGYATPEPSSIVMALMGVVSGLGGLHLRKRLRSAVPA